MMLDRLRRKLFLSVKVMGSDKPSSNESTDLGKAELLDILRRGSSALSQPGMPLTQFLAAGIDEILDASRSRDGVRDAKAKKELDAGADEQLLKDADEEERT